MILAIDVYYRELTAVVAGIAFESWHDEKPASEYICQKNDVLPYMPGSFFMRELPCIMDLLTKYNLNPEIIIIDGYVFLDGISKAGLGWHLYEALDKQVKIIGVAKTAYSGIGDEYKVYRGHSHKPLYVTTQGISLLEAKEKVKSMHGKNRIPTILKYVDQQSRIVL